MRLLMSCLMVGWLAATAVAHMGDPGHGDPGEYHYGMGMGPMMEQRLITAARGATIAIYPNYPSSMDPGEYGHMWYDASYELVCFDASGRNQWSKTISNAHLFSATLLEGGDTLVVASADGMLGGYMDPDADFNRPPQLSAYDAVTGSSLWTVTLSGMDALASPLRASEDGEALSVVAFKGRHQPGSADWNKVQETLFRIDSNGTILWTQRLR